MEAEREAGDHDDEDDGDWEKGVDDVLEENDVFSNTRVICHECFEQGFCKIGKLLLIKRVFPSRGAFKLFLGFFSLRFLLKNESLEALCWKTNYDSLCVLGPHYKHLWSEQNKS